MTYRAQSDGGSGQTNETSIASMGLMDGIGILVAELVKYSLDPRVVFCGSKLADDSFQPSNGAAR